MSLTDAIYQLYGQLRGYDRRRIYQAAWRLEQQERDVVRRWRDDRFQEHLAACLARFPVYAEVVKAHRGALPEPGERVDPASLPVWTKAHQRELFASLSGPPVPGAFKHSTGGSTGVPGEFYVTRASYEWRTAVSDRGYAWAGARLGVPSFYVWSIASKPPTAWQRRKGNLYSWWLNRRFFNCFQFAAADQRACARAIEAARPTVLVGYAGKLVDLALRIEAEPELLTWRADAVITACEGLQQGQRELLERYLGRAVFQSYGSREFKLIGMECERHDGFHLSEDNLYVEVVDDAGQHCAPGDVGRILVTDFNNAANPFIRYEIGDRGRMMADEPCACGRPFRRLAAIDGRLQEAVILPNGNRLTGIYFPHMLKDFAWIDAFQVYQERREEIEIRVLTDEPEVTAAMEAAVDRHLRPAMDSCRVRVVKVVERQTNASGKTPVIVSTCLPHWRAGSDG